MSEFLSRGVDFEVTRIGEWHENLSEKTGDGATKLFLVGTLSLISMFHILRQSFHCRTM